MRMVTLTASCSAVYLAIMGYRTLRHRHCCHGRTLCAYMLLSWYFNRKNGHVRNTSNPNYRKASVLVNLCLFIFFIPFCWHLNFCSICVRAYEQAKNTTVQMHCCSARTWRSKREGTYFKGDLFLGEYGTLIPILTSSAVYSASWWAIIDLSCLLVVS